MSQLSEALQLLYQAETALGEDSPQYSLIQRAVGLLEVLQAQEAVPVHESYTAKDALMVVLRVVERVSPRAMSSKNYLIAQAVERLKDPQVRYAPRFDLVASPDSTVR